MSLIDNNNDVHGLNSAAKTSVRTAAGRARLVQHARPCSCVWTRHARSSPRCIVATRSLSLFPAVLTKPIRLDVVQQVHKSVAKNKRQPYATSAESWGTDHAVARIPRVGGSGMHRSGQAAFGNMCRGERMFAPTAVWYQNQRRFAVVSALTASTLPVRARTRGHRIEQVEEVPLVVAAAESLTRAVVLLTALGAYADVQKVSSRKLRAGRGKLRNRRHRHRRGFLVVYSEDNGIVKTFRNLPGVELVNVTRLDLLQPAPGGYLGHFVIWAESAFAHLDEVFGTFDTAAVQKKDYFLSTAKIANPDVTCPINSSEIQAIHKNPLTNKRVLSRLNPYAKTIARVGGLVRERRGRAASAEMWDDTQKCRTTRSRRRGERAG
ncbi:ribosomal protein L4 domain-containing protein [Phellopilus nigrolimitatus]|nr:ribosomal protein L4 domain-containing protein [Phellopilus nigrolimitatus]